MALAVAFDDAKANQVSRDGDGRNITGARTQIPFFRFRENPELPHASLNQYHPGRVSLAHFHVNDQFQVIVDGKGRLGRHDLAPYCVHFSRAYTPYGPFVADAATGLIFFVLRAHYDPGAHRLPDKRDELRRVPDRQPWQLSRSVTFPEIQSGTVVADIQLQEVPGMKDERGLAAYTLSMRPNAKAGAPDPSHGDGQYLVVVKGSLLHGNKELKAPVLVFVSPNEGPFQMHAGPEGLKTLVLNFPHAQTRATAAAKNVHASTGFKTWQCTLCAFVYNEAAGLPEERIPPGTRWKDVPEAWSCPDCSSSKGDFQMIEP
jgi:rubredoxin